MLNTKKIKGRMVELGLLQKDIAAALNIAQTTVSQKINGVRPMTLQEAERMAKVLNIQNNQFGEYFFAQ